MSSQFANREERYCSFLKKASISGVRPVEQSITRQRRALLHEAMEAELATYLSRHAGARDASISGAERIFTARTVLTGLGEVPIRAPKTRDRDGQGRHFTSRLLPPYIKRKTSVESVLPWLC